MLTLGNSHDNCDKDLTPSPPQHPSRYQSGDYRRPPRDSEALTTLIGAHRRFSLVAVTVDGNALAKIGRQLPDVALVDIGLPGMSGIEGLRILKEKYPSLLLMMLTVYDDDERIFDAMCAGASGYLLKKTPPARLLESLKEAVAGGAPMSPEVARRVITLFREIRPPERAGYDLSPHETRLLKLFVRGHNYKTAAAELGVTVHTISFHLRSIYDNCKSTPRPKRSRSRSATDSCKQSDMQKRSGGEEINQISAPSFCLPPFSFHHPLSPQATLSRTYEPTW